MIGAGMAFGAWWVVMAFVGIGALERTRDFRDKTNNNLEYLRENQVKLEKQIQELQKPTATSYVKYGCAALLGAGTVVALNSRTMMR